ncbi:DUF1049 domain-containing protein [Alloalcanivorax gelatiniphagus]|uniref:DUF1049 domain-containing protein n=1 Tax=Alloalcanivorax gelatiniphagus TaxID=1194167 RepID=A0ABY2XP70_9GAMM|nr:DUF1049 domain-containing protein [Alloalcanivorax gelatiniphagus]TMW13392.1 DUF1049 domain-containing protein [Alloalcanivorax gelatiniphagus]|tara:strand:- start:3422 stop:3661 length:240 start_codon:yes stop_codon:yes gene_type:complete
MRNLYRICLIVALLAVFVAAFLFVTANTQLVTLALPVTGWQWQVTLGAMAVLLLALGLLLGLLTGLGLRGVRGLFGSRS